MPPVTVGCQRTRSDVLKPKAAFSQGEIGTRVGLLWTLEEVRLAERAGFEPALGSYPKHAFQACDLNHSSTSP